MRHVPVAILAVVRLLDNDDRVSRPVLDVLVDDVVALTKVVAVVSERNLVVAVNNVWHEFYARPT